VFGDKGKFQLLVDCLLILVIWFSGG